MRQCIGLSSNRPLRKGQKFHLMTKVHRCCFGLVGKWGPEEARTGGAQEGSGEESSEEAWQPDWGLSLFSALNPHVITTGGAFSRDFYRI